MNRNGYESECESEYFADDTLILEYEPGPSNRPLTTITSGALNTLSRGSSSSSKSKSTLGKRTLSESSITSYETANSAPRTKRPRISVDCLSEDRPVIIAHCEKVVRLFDKLGIKWGVRFEIARLVSSGRLKETDVKEEKLRQLVGLNAVSGPRIAQIFTNEAAEKATVDQSIAREMAAISPWEELDREESALKEGENEGIGNNPKRPGWYGGKIEFHAQIQNRNGEYKIILESPNLGASSRLTRKFGSWSFLRVRVPETIFYGNDRGLIPFFLRPFVIWGRVFRVCDSKRGSVFFYWTHETYASGSILSSPSPKQRKSLEEFISWHNPLEQNSKQLMSKWAARQTLGFSNSVPGPQLLPENILAEEDIVREGSDMTDGCGLSSQAVHLAIAQLLSLHIVPTAFQFRFGGCKGMLLLHDRDEYAGTELRAGFRPSQIKIKYPPGVTDPALFTIDLLRTSHMRSPAQISTEAIINLAENGVPSQAFEKLLVDSIRALVNGLMTWDGPDAMLNLWIQIERIGGVLSARRARELIGEARVRGYTNKSPDEIELERDADEGDDDDEEGFQATSRRSTPWWPDYISGCPSSLEETILGLLDAGFTPQNCPLLRSKLEQVVNTKIRNRMQKLRIEVDQSCVAFVVPDPFGILGPDEIQIKSSRRNLKTNDGLLTDVITGEVLITRSPCKLPTDVRKVLAVEHSQLAHLVDVIVCSIQGLRRLLDWLAGGDYDGDKVFVTWLAALVLAFRNADEKHASEPQGFDQAFERRTETVEAFLSESAKRNPRDQCRAMQTYLLGSLSDPALIGKYSNMHSVSEYINGYAHPRTVKLGHKVGRVLDGHKSGWKIKPETFTADHMMYSTPMPRWMADQKKNRKRDGNWTFSSKLANSSNLSYAKREFKPPYITRNFIMDTLSAKAKVEEDRLLTETKQRFAEHTSTPDSDLTRPWEELEAWAKRGSPSLVEAKMQDVKKIQEHVHSVFKEHSEKVKHGQNFTKLPIEQRQDLLRSISKSFASGPALEEVPNIISKDELARVRASYAYKYDVQKKGWSRFPFNVAMRELCAIKASANGLHKVVQTNFYERFKLMDRR
ncbi:RNA dependent RNA polymerase-domain-containing protein [Crepidotus variabilis]|uniref:RNA-dependent RNA polymerase n=1 Tax=Crepidotus variabilis TaxID=179855 RepID=A0A9P6JUS1_9AGAR|nr:RNA dependent RNA polymerase-domain-containing protein [Crepidotus variabilis]